jgi:hypothetical protein
MPSPELWAKAIRDAGFPVDLDSDFNPDTDIGFQPCRLRGVLSGFEYYSSRISKQDQQDLGVPPDYDFSVNLVTHSDLREFATSLIAASVLCQVSGGLLVDPQTGEQHALSGVLAWAREQLASFERELR